MVRNLSYLVALNSYWGIEINEAKDHELWVGIEVIIEAIKIWGISYKAVLLHFFVLRE